MRNQKGVSLVELMIALAVIAIALLGIVGVLLHTISVKESNREQQLAKTAATRQLETIRTAAKTNFDQISITFNNLTFPVSELANNGTGTVTVDSTNPDLLELRILIQWNGVRPNSRYEIRSLLTR
jgi:prepilin-type N-terminal cleavage/methylation domain-containing protein